MSNMCLIGYLIISIWTRSYPCLFDTWLTYPKDVYDEFGYSDSLVFNVNGVEVAPVQLDEKIRPTPDSVVDSADATWDLPVYTATINTDGVYKISQTFSGIQVKAIFRKYLTTPIGKIVIGEYESYAAGFYANIRQWSIQINTCF